MKDMFRLPGFAPTPQAQAQQEQQQSFAELLGALVGTFQLAEKYSDFIENSYRLYNAMIAKIYDAIINDQFREKVSEIMLISNESLARSLKGRYDYESDTIALRETKALLDRLNSKLVKMLNEDPELNSIARRLPMSLFIDHFAIIANVDVGAPRMKKISTYFSPVSMSFITNNMKQMPAVGTQIILGSFQKELKNFVEIKALLSVTPAVMSLASLVGHVVQPSHALALTSLEVLSTLAAVYKDERIFSEIAEITEVSLKEEIRALSTDKISFDSSSIEIMLDRDIESLERQADELGGIIGFAPDVMELKSRAEMLKKVREQVGRGRMGLKINAEIAVLHYSVAGMEMELKRLPTDAHLTMRILQGISTASDETNEYAKEVAMTPLPSLVNGLPIVLEVLLTFRGEETEPIRRELVDILKRWSKGPEEMKKRDVLSYAAMLLTSMFVKPLVPEPVFIVLMEKPPYARSYGEPVFKALLKAVEAGFKDPLTVRKGDTRIGPNMYL